MYLDIISDPLQPRSRVPPTSKLHPSYAPPNVIAIDNLIV